MSGKTPVGAEDSLTWNPSWINMKLLSTSSVNYLAQRGPPKFALRGFFTDQSPHSR